MSTSKFLTGSISDKEAGWTVERNALSVQIYERLKSQIMEGVLASGEKLSLDGLAERLNVSRTPVKEAFNRLRDDGLLTIHPQRGTYVSSINPDRLHELYEARLMVELWSVRKVATAAAPPRIDRMAAVVERCEALVANAAQFDYEAFVRLDMDFHYQIVEGAENPDILRFYDLVVPHVQVMRVLWGKGGESAQKSHRAHRRIFDAIRQQLPELAEQSLREHIAESLADVLRRMRGGLSE